MHKDVPAEPGGRGTAWVIAQVPLLLAAAVLPVAECRSRRPERTSPAVAATARITGLAGLTVSLTVLWLAARMLGSGLVPYPQPPDGAVLQEGGIYGRVRHPLYLGILCAIVGWAVFWRSRLGLALLVPGVAFFYAKSRYEERFLLARFPRYAEYRRRVPALVPRWRPRRTGPLC